jgi:hypothetical protein
MIKENAFGSKHINAPADDAAADDNSNNNNNNM